MAIIAITTSSSIKVNARIRQCRSHCSVAESLPDLAEPAPALLCIGSIRAESLFLNQLDLKLFIDYKFFSGGRLRSPCQVTPGDQFFQILWDAPPLHTVLPHCLSQFTEDRRHLSVVGYFRRRFRPGHGGWEIGGARYAVCLWFRGGWRGCRLFATANPYGRKTNHEKTRGHGDS